MFASKSLKVLMAGVFVIGAVLVGLGDQSAKADKLLSGRVCKKSACNLQKSIDDTIHCSGGGTNKKCKFTGSDGDLIWCDELEDHSCRVIEPIKTNKCLVYCDWNAGLSCYGTEYNICFNPQQ